MTQPRDHVPIPGPYEREQAWHDVRVMDESGNFVFGASDAAAVCNESDYKTSLDVARRITGQAPEETRSPESVNIMRRGRKMQPLIMEEYALEKDCEVIEPLRMYMHPDYHFIAATPDGIAFRAADPRWLVEAKAANFRMYSAAAKAEDSKYGEAGTDLIPMDVLFQVQQQMAVMGTQWCEVVVMFGLVMRTYPVERNDDLIGCIIDAETRLYEQIREGRLPDPQWTHPRTRKVLEDMYGFRAGDKVELPLEALDAWIKYQRLGDEIKVKETEREGVRNQLLSHMQGAEIGRFPAGTQELKRVRIADTFYTEADAEAVRAKVGQLKRRGSERLIERRSK
jgi:predicted phage-related endonuclease